MELQKENKQNSLDKGMNKRKQLLYFVVAVCSMREQEREELMTLLGVVVKKEVGEEEVERLREVEKGAKETQERLECTVCHEREVTNRDLN